jgi:peptidyl-tRNA hydrolase, PTH2 family
MPPKTKDKTVVNRDIKQVIVMRNDLNMRKGKMCAQAAHASIMFLVMRQAGKSSTKNFRIQDEWMEEGMTKICVRADSEEQLLAVYQQAQDADLTVHIIRDAGLTEFKEPTLTCLAIGPNLSADIDKITGDLKLL